MASSRCVGHLVVAADRQFTNVRIPRAYMLMKHTQVTRDGVVQEPPLQQLTYGALLQGRVAMVADAANVAKKALTIAIRYACVRRQFKTGDNPLETQILDYPIHQRRLMPLAAQAIAMGFTGLRMTALYEKLSGELESLDASADKATLDEVIETLKETHATSAGLKAFCTWTCLETIEKCRQACGSSALLLVCADDDQVATATARTPVSRRCTPTRPSSARGRATTCVGESCTCLTSQTILTLQAGRALISSFEDAQKGKRLGAGVAYLGSKSIRKAKCPSDDKVGDLATIDQAWGCVASMVVEKSAKAYDAFVAKGKGRDEALELCSQQRFIAAKGPSCRPAISAEWIQSTRPARSSASSASH